MSLRPWTWSPLRTLSHTLSGQAHRSAARFRRRKAPPSAQSPGGYYGHGFASERLEPRQLLTTLQGGDIFEYAQDASTWVRIRLEGNIQAEFLSARVSSRYNRARIGNLSGRLNRPGQPPLDIIGGIGGPGGIDVIGPVNSPLQGNPDIQALAAHPTSGVIYAFDVETIPIEDPPDGEPNFTTIVQLIQLSFPATPPVAPYGPGPGNTVGVNGGFVADLTTALRAAGQFAPVTVSVAAADFNPINGLLYFVVRSGEAAIDQLFTLDVNAGSIPGSIQAVPGFFNDSDEDGIQVAGITFDQTGPSTAQLIGVLGDDQGADAGGGGGGGGQDQQPALESNPARLVIINQNDTDFLTPIGFFDPQNPGPVDLTIGAIETLEDDPTQIDSILMIGSNEGYEVVRNDPDQNVPNGLLIRLGELAEPPNPPGNPPLPPPPAWIPDAAGANGLTFVPNIVDPFTGAPGAYIGYDAASDHIYFVNRFEHDTPVTIFQIYVASSDLTGRIAIAQVDVPPRPNADLRPFDGDIGAVRHINAQDPTQFPWPTSTAGSDIGPVLIGAKSLDVNPNDPNEDLRLLPTALVPPEVNLGLVPGSSLQIDPDTGLRVVDAGMTVIGDIDRVLIDGAVTGTVAAVRPPGENPIGTGSINQFYCGWLLTGNGQGDVAGSPTRPQNFRVAGDLRDLYVLDSIGSDTGDELDEPTYLTGFDLQVVGNLGHIRTGDSLLGAFQVRNEPGEDPGLGINVVQTEIETRGPSAWDAFQFSGNAFFNNDTFDTPEFRGTINSLGNADMVQSVGVLQHVTNVDDWVDYYAVSLMAGQTVQAQLVSDFPGVVNLGVFDPDGRLIASDYSNSVSAAGVPFSFRTDRPGSYRFAIGASGNANFVNARTSALNTAIPYEFRVTNVGDLAVGGVSAAVNIFDVPLSEPLGVRGYLVEFGDLGSFRAGNAILSISQTTVAVLSGNLRELDGASIGFGTAAVPADPNDPNAVGTAAGLNAAPDIHVPAGSVGLVRARTGILFLNPLAPALGRSIGGDFQVIDGASSVGIDLVADGGVGVVRAGDMATVPASTIAVNFDNNGEDGIIDLIDVVGNLGTLNAGGPRITTNTGGNVRYMRVGGAAFIDAAFGGGTPIRTLHQPGETVTLTDDSGSIMRLVPNGRTAATPPNGTPSPQDLNALIIRSYPIRGSGGVVVIDITTDDSVNIDTSGGFGGTAEIGTIVVQGARAIGPRIVRDPTQRVADFTTLLDQFAPVPSFVGPTFNSGFEPTNPGSGGGLGEPDYRRAPNPLISLPVLDEDDIDDDPATPAPDLTPRPLEVIIRGNVKTDVFSIVGVDANNIDGDGQFSVIRNDTDGGELVNITAVSVGEIISNGTIGLARPSIANVALHTAVSASGASVPFPSTEYPLAPQGGTGALSTVGQRSGVWIYGDLDENSEPYPLLIQNITAATPLPEPGNVISIRARDGLGNIIVNGNIGEVIPNKDNLRNRPGIFAGIQGPVWARGNPTVAHTAFGDEGGDIYFVDIGEGITASGSGAFARSGLFAGRRIDTVQGENADIRGDIIAGDDVNPLDVETETTVVNGQLVSFSRRISIPDSIGRIVLRNGSIINADVMVTTRSFESREQGFPLTSNEYPEPLNEVFYELGAVEIRGNGGIIGSFFSASDVGPIDVNRGFGIFNSVVIADADSRFAGLESDNYGIRGVIVSAGASMNFINARGDGGSVSTAAFSPSVRRSEPQFGGLDQYGVDPLSGLAPSPLTDIHATLGTSEATAEVPGRTDTGVIEDIDIRGQRDLGVVRGQRIRSQFPDLAPSRINIANRIGGFYLRDQTTPINGLSVTTGRLGNFRPQGDVFNLELTVAGPLKELVIGGDLADGSVIRTQGSSGNMGNIRILGRLDGDILSSGRIKKLFVAESISGNVESNARRGNAVGQLLIGGDIAEGGLAIRGNMGRIVIGGDFGRTGTLFSVQGKLGSLTVRGNLFSNIRVGSTLGRLNVGGSIMSGVTIEAQRIGGVQVGGDVQPGVIFRATRPPKIRTGGQMLGTYEPLA